MSNRVMFYRCHAIACITRNLSLSKQDIDRVYSAIVQRGKQPQVKLFQCFAVKRRHCSSTYRRKFILANMASRKVCCLLGKPNKLCVTRGSVLTVAVRGNASWEPVDKVIHTGQKFDENDKRMVRFVDRQKEVNNNWAIKLIDEVPPKLTKDRVIACDGGGGPLGHPKVYINLDKPGNHACGYCGLRFYKEDHHH